MLGSRSIGPFLRCAAQLGLSGVVAERGDEEGQQTHDAATIACGLGSAPRLRAMMTVGLEGRGYVYTRPGWEHAVPEIVSQACFGCRPWMARAIASARPLVLSANGWIVFAHGLGREEDPSDGQGLEVPPPLARLGGSREPRDA
jgi:hypothetical protein